MEAYRGLYKRKDLIPIETHKTQRFNKKMLEKEEGQSLFDRIKPMETEDEDIQLNIVTKMGTHIIKYLIIQI